MTNWDKLKLAREHLMALGLGSHAGAPPILRVFWLFHVPVPPFFFWHFSSVALFTGTFFGFVFGVIMWMFFLHSPATPLWVTIGTAAAAGAAFGIYNARRMRGIARKFGLPHWAAYSGMRTAAAHAPTPADIRCEQREASKKHPNLTKLVPCPYCEEMVLVTPLSFLSRWFVGPRIRCHHCHNYSTVTFRLRAISYACGFATGMLIIGAYVVALVVSNVAGTPGIWAVVICSILGWMFVELLIRFTRGALVKSAFQRSSSA